MKEKVRIGEKESEGRGVWGEGRKIHTHTNTHTHAHTHSLTHTLTQTDTRTHTHPATLFLPLHGDDPSGRALPDDESLQGFDVNASANASLDCRESRVKPALIGMMEVISGGGMRIRDEREG